MWSFWFLIFDFFFLRMFTWCKVPCQLKSFPKAKIFFPPHREHLNGCPRYFFPGFPSCKYFLSGSDGKCSAPPSTSPDAAQRGMASSKAVCSWSTLLSLSYWRLFCRRRLKRPTRSLHVTWCVSNESHGPAASPSSRVISIYSHTTSWQALCGGSEQPAIQIDGDNECCSFPSARKQRKIIPPLLKVSKKVGGAWIVWNVAQPIGSLW